MAVYTVLSGEAIARLIEPFDIGPLLDFEGVAAGIENTNYFIRTGPPNCSSEDHTAPTQEFVLTIFEHINTEQLSFYVELTTLLNHHSLPVPCPIQDIHGAAIHSIRGKPVLIVPKLKGAHPSQTPSIELCANLGATLAQIHVATRAHAFNYSSNRNLSWIKQCADSLRPQLNTDDQSLLAELPRFHRRTEEHPDLPQGIIHGDLFRDNALVEGHQIRGIIDFNSAGYGYLLMDLAIAANDWCSKAGGQLDPNRLKAMTASYQRIRPITNDEETLWNDFLRIAAMRFWVSRLFSQLKPETNRQTNSLVEPKDPQEFKNILKQRINSPQIWVKH